LSFDRDVAFAVGVEIAGAGNVPDHWNVPAGNDVSACDSPSSQIDTLAVGIDPKDVAGAVGIEIPCWQNAAAAMVPAEQ